MGALSFSLWAGTSSVLLGCPPCLESGPHFCTYPMLLIFQGLTQMRPPLGHNQTSHTHTHIFTLFTVSWATRVGVSVSCHSFLLITLHLLTVLPLCF